MLDLVATFNAFQGQGNNIVIGINEMKWKKPRQGYVKLNTGGAWRISGQAGAGWVIRGDHGGWIAGKSKKICARNSTEAELIAFRDGLAMALAAGHRCIIVENVASLLKKTIEEVEKYNTHELAVILKELEELLKGNSEVEFNFIPREGNFVAHYLAKLAVEMVEPES